MKITGIHHVQLCITADQEKEAKTFYAYILGLKEITKPEALQKNGGMWFQIGSQELHIGVENPAGFKGKQHPAFLVENLEDWRSHLTEQGITINKETPIPGFNRFSIHDPFENRIELIEVI